MGDRAGARDPGELLAHAAFVWRIALCLVGAEHGADDVVQEAG